MILLTCSAAFCCLEMKSESCCGFKTIEAGGGVVVGGRCGTGNTGDGVGALFNLLGLSFNQYLNNLLVCWS